MDFARHGRELGEAALGDDALKHEFAVLGRRGGEERPDVGDGLLVCSGETVEVLGRVSIRLDSMIRSNLHAG